jgi:hypothetical protein
MDQLLVWERNLIGEFIAHVEDKMFFRIAPSINYGCSLWLIRRSDHLLGGLRNPLGWFASEEDAQSAAETYL